MDYRTNKKILDTNTQQQKKYMADSNGQVIVEALFIFLIGLTFISLSMKANSHFTTQFRKNQFKKYKPHKSQLNRTETKKRIFISSK